MTDTMYTTADGKLLKVQKSEQEIALVGNWGPTEILVILRIQVHEGGIS